MFPERWCCPLKKNLAPYIQKSNTKGRFTIMVCSHSSGKSKNNAHSFDALDFLKQERDRLKLENSRLQEEIDTLEQSPYTRLGKAFTLCSQHPEIFGEVDLHKFCALFLDDNGHEECTHNDRDEDFCPNDEEDVDKICVCIHGSFEDDSDD